jgi:DNA repair protein RadC
MNETKQYAYTIRTTKVLEPDFPYHGQQISCTNELVEFVKSLQDADIEKFITLYMNNDQKLICIQVQTGTVTQAHIYPREVLRHALLSGATGIILVHNHPSGAVMPSDADIRITKTLVDISRHLDIEIHDHLIIGGSKFYSFMEGGIMPVRT